MSWSMTIPATPIASLDKEVADALPSPATEDPKILAQVATAKRMIKNAAKDFLAAEPHTHISASVSGHKEPEHPNRDGYSPDGLWIAVNCACRVGMKT